jgi:hypothetical protein
MTVIGCPGTGPALSYFHGRWRARVEEYGIEVKELDIKLGGIRLGSRRSHAC